MIQQKAFAVTQGGADTAAETSVATNIQPGITLDAWSLVGVEFTIKPDVLKGLASADSDITLQVMKRSLSGNISRVVTYADSDLLASWNMAIVAAGTPATLLPIEGTFYLTVPPSTLIYSEYVYIQLISTATELALSVWGRLIYEPVTLSKDEALRVVASRP